MCVRSQASLRQNFPLLYTCIPISSHPSFEKNGATQKIMFLLHDPSLNRPRARSVIPSFPLPPFCLADLWVLLLLLFGHVYLHMGFPPQKARLESVDEMKMNPTRRQIWHEQTNPIALTTFVFPYDMLNVPCLKWDTVFKAQPRLRVHKSGKCTLHPQDSFEAPRNRCHFNIFFLVGSTF